MLGFSLKILLLSLFALLLDPHVTIC